MNFSTKEMIGSYVYTTINENREGEMEERINGRLYLKFGTFQAVTCVGHLYKVWDPSVNLYKNVLLVGVAKQHPCDVKCSKSAGIEVAAEKAFVEPTMVMEVGENFDKFIFKRIMFNYIDSLKLSFIKTKAEMVALYGEAALDKYIR